MANERLPCLRSCFLFLYGWFLIKLYISYENWMYVKYVGNFFCLVCYNKHKFCLNTVNFPWSLIDETNLSRGFLKDFKKIYHEKNLWKQISKERSNFCWFWWCLVMFGPLMLHVENTDQLDTSGDSSWLISPLYFWHFNLYRPSL